MRWRPWLPVALRAWQRRAGHRPQGTLCRRPRLWTWTHRRRWGRALRQSPRVRRPPRGRRTRAMPLPWPGAATQRARRRRRRGARRGELRTRPARGVAPAAGRPAEIPVRSLARGAATSRPSSTRLQLRGGRRRRSGIRALRCVRRVQRRRHRAPLRASSLARRPAASRRATRRRLCGPRRPLPRSEQQRRQRRQPAGPSTSATRSPCSARHRAPRAVPRAAPRASRSRRRRRSRVAGRTRCLRGGPGLPRRLFPRPRRPSAGRRMAKPWTDVGSEPALPAACPLGRGTAASCAE